jgi:hypothetical protein
MVEKRFPQGGGGGGTRIFRRRIGENEQKKGTREQGIESARPLDLVHALIVRRSGEIICKPLRSGRRLRIEVSWFPRSEKPELGHMAINCHMMKVCL